MSQSEQDAVPINSLHPFQKFNVLLFYNTEQRRFHTGQKKNTKWKKIYTKQFNEFKILNTEYLFAKYLRPLTEHT